MYHKTVFGNKQVDCFSGHNYFRQLLFPSEMLIFVRDDIKTLKKISIGQHQIVAACLRVLEE